MKAKNEGKNSDNIFCYFRKKKTQIRKKQEFGMVMPSLASFSQ